MQLNETAIVTLRREFVDVYGLDQVRAALELIARQDADAAESLPEFSDELLGQGRR